MTKKTLEKANQNDVDDYNIRKYTTNEQIYRLERNMLDDAGTVLYKHMEDSDEKKNYAGAAVLANIKDVEAVNDLIDVKGYLDYYNMHQAANDIRKSQFAEAYHLLAHGMPGFD